MKMADLVGVALVVFLGASIAYIFWRYPDLRREFVRYWSAHAVAQRMREWTERRRPPDCKGDPMPAPSKTHEACLAVLRASGEEPLWQGTIDVDAWMARNHVSESRTWMEAYGDWLDAPGLEHFGRCVWRLVWSVGLFVLVGTAIAAAVLATLLS